MKPIIGISASRGDSESAKAMAELVEKMGAVPCLICDHQGRDLQEDITHVTAWVLMGNDYDIAPQSYIERYELGSAKRQIHPKTKCETTTLEGQARARYEEALIPLVLEHQVPMVGICGGMQRINVVLGGTLHQHIPDLVGDDRHCQKTRGVDPRTAEIPMIIEGGTTLAEIAFDIEMPFIKDCQANDPKVIYENSIHHQAIDMLAEGFRRCCVSDVVCLKSGKSGYLVKGIEVDPQGKYAGHFILGLQWHPEYCASQLGTRIIARLIQEADFYRYGMI